MVHLDRIPLKSPGKSLETDPALSRDSLFAILELPRAFEASCCDP
jgi:hypothetical protein